MCLWFVSTDYLGSAIFGIWCSDKGVCGGSYSDLVNTATGKSIRILCAGVICECDRSGGVYSKELLWSGVLAKARI